MVIAGFVEYQKREFCKDVKCPMQFDLENQKNKEEYERVRQNCSQACRFTTWQFHHWLIEKGYLIVRREGHSET